MAFSLQERAEQRVQARLELARRSCQRFITRYVKIEDRDAPDLAVPFEMWPDQLKALSVFLNERLVVVLKARQLGLSWLALAYAVWQLVFIAGFSVVALSRREEDSKELVRRVAFILRHLPPWMVRHDKDVPAGYGGPVWDSTALTVTITHPGKEPAVFRAFPASADSGRSFTASLVILDEWAFHQWADDIWSAAYPTINRPTGGQVLGISTGKVGTLFEETWDGAMAGENGFAPVFLAWNADPRRTREWYEATKAALPKTYRAEYPATPEEAFTVGEGAAFPEWDKTIHAPHDADWYPPDGWKLVRGYDGGWTRACCKWYAIDPDGRAVCYREYYPSQIHDDVQAAEIVRLSKDPDGISEQISYTVADGSCWNKQPGGLSTAETFAKAGIHMRKADKDRENGAKRVHMWLKPFEDPKGDDEDDLTATLTFTAACKNTIRTYPGLPADKHKPDDVDTDAEDHPYDVDRYFVMSRPVPKPDEKEQRRRARKRRRASQPRSSITGY